MGRGERVIFWALAEARAYGIVVDVFAMRDEVVAVADAVVGEATLPDGKLRFEAA